MDKLSYTSKLNMFYTKETPDSTAPKTASIIIIT